MRDAIGERFGECLAGHPVRRHSVVDFEPDPG
jgi:hypothetical protein